MKRRFPIILKVIILGIGVSILTSGTAISVSYLNQRTQGEKNYLDNIDYTLDAVDEMFGDVESATTTTYLGYLRQVKKYVKDIYDVDPSRRGPEEGETFEHFANYYAEKYSWLYSTTYWNGAYFSSPTTYSSRYFIFTGSMGKICGGGFPNCAVKSYLGCGIRPVITIPNEVEYLIQTDTNENGEIEVIENALEGGEVSFSVKPNSGYKLASLVIKKANGEVVEITSDDLVENEDGTITTLNHFTMPNESVIIEARWVSTNELINPETRNVFFIIFCFIVFSCIAFGFHYNKKQRV